MAAALRAEGLKLREIAERMGVAVSTVDAWINDPGGERLRRRKDSYRGRCVGCGEPTDGSNGSEAAPVRCKACAALQPHPDAPARADRVLEMVRLRVEENLTNIEISNRLGVPVSTVATELKRMRVLGFLVPVAPYNNASVRGPTYIERSTKTLERELAARGITPEAVA